MCLSVVLLVCLATNLIAIADSNEQVSDFVIVGAGTAGCVLAANLCSRLPAATITLLERGLPRNDDTEFLVRAARNQVRAFSSQELAEIFPSLPIPGFLNRSSPLITGNTLGGSSSINGMQFTIPIRKSVDDWAIRGLSFSTAQRFYDIIRQKVGFAPQPLEFQQIYTDEYIRASESVGFPELNNPFEGVVQDGIWKNYIAADLKGRRRDSCSVYLQPALSGACTANLRVLQSATVSRIVLGADERTGNMRAKGIEYVHTLDRNRTSVRIMGALREVILAAGPYGSPKLLQLSGIGPKEVLREAGITPVVELPVGQRTQGRSVTSITSLYTRVPIEPGNDGQNLNASARLQFEQGEGGVYGKAITATNMAVGLSGYAIMRTIGEEDFGLGEPIIDSSCRENPTSFGFLRVRNADPFQPPDVQMSVLNSQVDIGRMLTCLQRFSKVHDAIDERFGIVDLPPTGAGLNESFVRSSARISWHYVGGCAVGSVVDDTLRVRGVAGLRVIDASVLRSMPLSAGPLASVYMVAEYASQKLSEEYRCLFSRRRYFFMFKRFPWLKRIWRGHRCKKW